MKNVMAEIRNLEKTLSKMGQNNPSLYKTPEKFTDVECFNAIRQDLQAELDAISLYEAHKAATDNQELIKILDHIIAEEKDHIALLQNFLDKNGQWEGTGDADYKAD